MKKLLPIIILLVIGGVFFFLENKDNKNIKNVILKKFTPQVEKNDNLVNQSDEDVTSNKNTSEEIIEQEEESIPITSKKESDPAPAQIVESNISDDSQADIIEEKENDVIHLNDNVTYSYEMKLFECVGCFSNELINILQNAKGTYLIEGNLHIVYLKRITGLSGKYNDEKYYGMSHISKIITAGGEEKMENSHSGELLTLKICKQYNLNCEE